MQRLQRRHLPRSRWTARADLPGSSGERHFEVLEVGAAGERELVVMRAILTDRRYQVAIAALRDPAAWTPGWVSVIAEGDVA